MGKIDIDRLELLVPRLADDPRVSLAFLFGSYARGQAGPLSDVDIALRLADGVARECYAEIRLAYMATVAQVLGDDRVDVIVLNTAPPLLAHEAIRGRVLFERSPEERVRFVVDVQRRYLDLKHLYAIDAAYLRERLARGTYGKP
jgi:uncharacterized protein